MTYLKVTIPSKYKDNTAHEAYVDYNLTKREDGKFEVEFYVTSKDHISVSYGLREETVKVFRANFEGKTDFPEKPEMLEILEHIFLSYFYKQDAGIKTTSSLQDFGYNLVHNKRDVEFTIQFLFSKR